MCDDPLHPHTACEPQMEHWFVRATLVLTAAPGIFLPPSRPQAPCSQGEEGIGSLSSALTEGPGIWRLYLELQQINCTQTSPKGAFPILFSPNSSNTVPLCSSP